MFFVKYKVKFYFAQNKGRKKAAQIAKRKKNVAEKKGRKNSKKRRIEASCSNPNSSGTRSTSDTDSGSTTD